MNDQARRSYRVAIATWLEARLYVAAAFIVTDAILERLEPPPAFTPLSDGLLAWDGTWYQRIADHGYADAADPAVRFFPLFPLLGRWIGWFVGGSELALILLANVASLIAALLLYRLAMQETNDPKVAHRAVRTLALFPPAFVFVLAYSEGLYLALALGMILILRSQRWLLAAALGFLAGLTRPVAGFLALAALVNVVRGRHTREPAAILSVLSAPLGTITFLVWSHFALHDWRAPIDRQEELRGTGAEPVTRLVRAAIDGVRGDQGELFHFIAAAIVIGLAVIAIKRLSTDLWIYAVPSTLVLVATDNLNSLERYALSVFPLVIAAAIASRHPAFDRWLPTASAVGLVAVTTLALNGVYVP